MKKILSIDGGGIRGIVPGQVLIALESKLQQRTQNPKARLADYFDFFAGTSTGAILTCIYLCPTANDSTRARFSAEEAVALYLEYGDDIFDVSFWQRVRTQDGVTDEKYEADELEKRLKQYMDDLKLSQLLKPCLITAYDIEKRVEFFFTQHDALSRGAGYDFLVRDVARATSAAPTYFEAAKIKALDGRAYPLIDGGMFMNNPALGAYSEVRNGTGNPTTEDMFVVSLGTGSSNRSYDYDEAKDWGAIGWVKPVIDIMMSGASATTNYHLDKIFSASGRRNQYIRIQPDGMGNANSDIDDASAENLRALAELGTTTAQQNDAELNRIADVLLDANPDPVRFA